MSIESIFPKELKWEVKTPKVEGAEKIPDVTGGYLLGSFDIINPQLSQEQQKVAEYRFIHEYSFTQDPEWHDFYISGTPEFSITNVRFGHSYGYLDVSTLWKFEEWMTQLGEREFPITQEPYQIQINWEDRLPYPEGENYKGKFPEMELKK